MVAVQGLFGLAEKEHDPRPFRSGNLALCFVGSLRSCQSVAGLVVTRLSIYQDCVAMGAVALDIIQGDLPGSGGGDITQRDLTPPIEGASDFDRRRLRRLIGWNRPTEHFSEAGPLFAFLNLGAARNCRQHAGLRGTCPASLLAFDEIGDGIDHKWGLRVVALALLVGQRATLPGRGVE